MFVHVHCRIYIFNSSTAQSVVNMAKPLTPGVTPAAGYWTTENYDEAVNFIVHYLEEKKSIKLVIHTSAIFLKDAEEIEIHVKSNVDAILDIDHLQIQDFFGEVFKKLTDPEDFPSVEGSGLSFIRICRWWFKLAHCQPNNTVNASARNTISTDWPTIEVDETDSSGPSITTTLTADTVIGCIALYHVYVAGHNKTQRRRAVSRWIQKNLYQIPYQENIHISELPAWHNECGLFNLQIFNNRGNVIYKKKFNDIQLFYTLNR